MASGITQEARGRGTGFPFLLRILSRQTVPLEQDMLFQGPHLGDRSESQICPILNLEPVSKLQNHAMQLP